MHKTKNINGDFFIEYLLGYKGDKQLYIKNKDMIEFRQVLIALDRLNDDNPFAIMNFIFKLSNGGEAGGEIKLSLIETLLREVKSANNKGRISLLLDSLEYIYSLGEINRMVIILSLNDT